MKDTLGRENRKHADRRCETCGNLYRPTHKNSRFCSRPCLWKTNGGWNKKDSGEVWWRNKRGYIQGYVWINGKPRQFKQHRWILEQALGRPLLRSEVAHHINGIKDDNRLENLEIIAFGEHSRLHNARRIAKRGYKLNLSSAQRQARSERAKKRRLGDKGRFAKYKAQIEEG